MFMGKYPCIFYETADGKSPVEGFMDSLDEGTQDKFIYKKELLEEFGPQLRHPHTDSLGDGIFELRFKGKEGQVRILFFFYGGEIIFINGFIKKTRKIPEKEIKIAKVRRREVERRGK
mgnify:CR=1 FL=1